MAQRRSYQAMLARPESLARVRAAQRVIEQAGGKVETRQTGTPGLVAVTILLPAPYTPEQFVPGIPFFPD